MEKLKSLLQTTQANNLCSWIILVIRIVKGLLSSYETAPIFM
jgi:hypothetical protein